MGCLTCYSNYTCMAVKLSVASDVKVTLNNGFFGSTSVGCYWGCGSSVVILL